MGSEGKTARCEYCLYLNCARGKGSMALCELGARDELIDGEACQCFAYSNNRVDGYVENKEMILERLFRMLQAVREGGVDIKGISLSGDHTQAVIEWNNGAVKKVDVAAMSGRTLVMAVLKAIGWPCGVPVGGKWMKSQWEVFSRYIGGKDMYTARRILLDTSQPQPVGEVETRGGYTADRDKVQALVDKLNEGM